MSRILAIDDMPESQLLISASLSGLGQVDVAENLQRASSLLRSHRYDLLILDIHLPDGNGLQFLHELKSAANRIPVLLLSGDKEITSIVTGFHVGAFDYVSKPFNPLELKVRVERILKSVAVETSVLCHEACLRMNPERLEAELWKGDAWIAVPLTVKEFRILHLLAKNPGRVISRQRIMDLVWGQETHLTERTIDSHVASLRRKLGTDRELVQAVRGEGYRFEPADSHKAAA